MIERGAGRLQRGIQSLLNNEFRLLADFGAGPEAVVGDMGSRIQSMLSSARHLPGDEDKVAANHCRHEAGAG